MRKISTTSLVPVVMIAVTIMWMNEDNSLKIAGARLDMMYLDFSTIAIDTQVGTFVILRCIIFFV
jgi:hypothetical protein